MNNPGYATITYYLHNRAEVDAYLERIHRLNEEEYQKARANPSPTVERLRNLRAQREPESA